MSWGYCLGDHKATAFPYLKSSSVVLALAVGHSAKSRGCNSSENPLSDRMASTVQHRVRAQINSLEKASSASRARYTPAVSHLFTEVQCWQRVALFFASNEA